MKKCEWKDGYYHPCKPANDIDSILSLGMTISESLEKKYQTMGITFCPFCGADIQRPNPLELVPEEGFTLDQQLRKQQIKKLQIQNEVALGNLVSKDSVKVILETINTALKNLQSIT